MVLQDLHGGHVLCVDVVRGQSVASLQQVHILHIEFADALTIELDAAIAGHLNAGHTPQHVADDAVALLLVGSDEIVERVTVLPYLLRTDADLLQLHGLFLHAEVEPLRTIRHNLHLVADGESRGRHGHRVCLRRELQPIVSLRVRVGEAQYAPRTFRPHGDVGVHHLALCIKHCTLDDGLGVGRQCYKCEDEGDYDFLVHIFLFILGYKAARV